MRLYCCCARRELHVYLSLVPLVGQVLVEQQDVVYLPNQQVLLLDWVAQHVELVRHHHRWCSRRHDLACQPCRPVLLDRQVLWGVHLHRWECEDLHLEWWEVCCCLHILIHKMPSIVIMYSYGSFMQWFMMCLSTAEVPFRLKDWLAMTLFCMQSPDLLYLVLVRERTIIGIGSWPILVDRIGSVSGIMNDADRRFMNAATNAIYCG